MKITVLDIIASFAESIERCVDTEKCETMRKDLEKFVETVFPHGSGFDYGTKIAQATSKKIVLETEYHHMNDCGYTNWTHHKIILTPAFNSYNMRVTGRNQNEIKDIIADMFTEILDTDTKELWLADEYRGHYYNFSVLEWMKPKNEA